MLRLFYPYEYADSVFSIDFEALKQKGYKAILFDIDNTLVHHGDDSTEEIDKLFDYLHGLGFQTLLLSNNDQERIERFNKNIETLYICDAEKPNPKNYRKALAMMKVKKEEAVVHRRSDFYGYLWCKQKWNPICFGSFYPIERRTEHRNPQTC